MTGPDLEDLEDEGLRRLARELGRGALGGLDPERISERVISRLQTEPRVRSRAVVVRWAIGLAAAAALAMAVLTRTGPGDPVPAAALVALPELDDLTAAELEAVLETIPLPADSSVHVETAPLDELNAGELERVLRTLE